MTRLLSGRSGGAPAIAGDQAKHLARSPDPTVRAGVAQSMEAPPELLYFLARDPSPAVRLAVAAHLRTPRQADLLLALDDDPAVRGQVARKIAGQVENLSRDDTAQLWTLTLSVLEALARDDLPQVRQLIAESARGVAKMPVTMMTALGRDQVAEVAVPALGFAGRITDDDLVQIVAHAPDPRVVGAVARRPAIGARVSDAVVESGDSMAITILLENASAEIAPQTMDRIVEQAPPIEAWHEPLVKRPNLSEATAMKLAGFVAQKLAKFLQTRPDLGARPGSPITILVQQRQSAAQMAGSAAGEETPLGRARRHYAAGTLGEGIVTQAFGTDPDFVIAALSLRSRLPPAVVNKILLSHSAKGLTSLAWKAGYTMRFAFQLQLRVAHLPPKARLSAAAGGLFPLSVEEMEWQLDFFRTLVPAEP